MTLTQIDEYIAGLEKLIPEIRQKASSIMEYSPFKQVTAEIFVSSLEAQLEFAYAVKSEIQKLYDKLEEQGKVVDN